MERRVISMDRDPRREQFQLFSGYTFPYAGVTVQLDVTALELRLRAEHKPVFLTMLYVIHRAVNRVPELRRRIEDFRDPTRKTRAQRLEQTLATALGPDGLFALQEQRVGLQQKQESLQALGADLAIQFNDQGNSMLQANRHRVEQVGTGSRQAIGRGALGFLAVARCWC